MKNKTILGNIRHRINHIIKRKLQENNIFYVDRKDYFEFEVCEHDLDSLMKFELEAIFELLESGIIDKNLI
jgi:hypothetical protein